MGYFGSSPLSAIKFGSSAVSRVYQGSSLLWQPGGGDTSVSLLLHMDEADGSTVFADSSTYSKTVTRGGTPAMSSAQAPAFQSTSGAFNGTTDYLQIANDATFDFGDEQWTIETWVYLNAKQDAWIFDRGNSGQYSVRFGYMTANNGWSFYISADGSTLASGVISDATPHGAWHHLAVTYDPVDNIIWCYKNGGYGTSFVFSGPLHSSTADVYIGANALGTNRFWNGYLADFRVTKGVSHYLGSGSFTPPGKHPNP